MGLLRGVGRPHRGCSTKQLALIAAAAAALQPIVATAAVAIIAGQPVRCEPWKYCKVDFDEGRCVPTKKGVKCKTIPVKR